MGCNAVVFPFGGIHVWKRYPAVFCFTGLYGGEHQPVARFAGRGRCILNEHIIFALIMHHGIFGHGNLSLLGKGEGACKIHAGQQPVG